MIKVGSVVRLSDSFCESVQADHDMANTLGIVREVFPKRGQVPARARVQWDDGFSSGALIRNLSEYRGVVPLATKQELGLV